MRNRTHLPKDKLHHKRFRHKRSIPNSFFFRPASPTYGSGERLRINNPSISAAGAFMHIIVHVTPSSCSDINEKVSRTTPSVQTTLTRPRRALVVTTVFPTPSKPHAPKPLLLASRHLARLLTRFGFRLNNLRL